VRLTDPRGLQAKGCCECPEREWSFSGWGGSFGLLWGLSYVQGTYTCRSNPSLKVDVKITCTMKGLFAGISPFYYQTSLPFIPGAHGCNATDLTNPDPQTQLFGSVGPTTGGGTPGFDNSGTLSIGPSAGYGAGVQDCYTNAWRRPGD
jgi:hypothetical protein